jgi:hypothetical protein
MIEDHEGNPSHNRTKVVPGGRGFLALTVRALLVLGMVLLSVMTVFLMRIAPLLIDTNQYGGVVSIEWDPAFHNAATLNAAWHMPVAARYLKNGFEYQRNQSFCGPTSAADVLHSLGDARTQQQMLVATPFQTWFGYLLGGLTLDQEAYLLHRQSHLPVAVLRELTLDQFRAKMRELNDPHRRTIVNFHRGPLFGRGHGHFSPLLAYLPDRDLVLVGDVNADYRPFLVSTQRLWQATDTIDQATGKRRGLIVVTVE